MLVTYLPFKLPPQPPHLSSNNSWPSLQCYHLSCYNPHPPAPQLPEGCTVCVAGNHPLYGKWDPDQAVEATEIEPGVWYVTTLLPASFLEENFEFKAMLIDTDGRIDWEGGPNRVIATGTRIATAILEKVSANYSVDVTIEWDWGTRDAKVTMKSSVKPKAPRESVSVANGKSAWAPATPLYRNGSPSKGLSNGGISSGDLSNGGLQAFTPSPAPPAPPPLPQAALVAPPAAPAKPAAPRSLFGGDLLGFGGTKGGGNSDPQVAPT